MSIPPLVCSTPPPPDQCEDDKDPEDFELSYSLSQDDEDDDENGYNYGSFSYNFQSTTDNKSLEIKQEEITRIESEVQKEIFLKLETDQNNTSEVFGTSDINENKLKCDEDLNIEDLNLKVDQEVESVIESSTEQIDTVQPNISDVKEFDIPNNSSNDNQSCDDTNVLKTDESTVDTTETIDEYNTNFVEQSEEKTNNEKDEKVEPYEEITENVLEDNHYSSLNEIEKPIHLEDTTINYATNTEQTKETIKLEAKTEENVIDDDFGDFDDFQSVNTNITSVVESSNNPWENSDASELHFKNFTANFDENQFPSDPSTNDLTQFQSASQNLDQVDDEIKEPDNDLDDDDFGDFNDFKSSVKPDSIELTVEDVSPCQELPVLNLQSSESEHQIIESITKVLSSVFLEEISEPENVFEGKLESLLSETWGHLMETDERQPYIVNWNNSLGQKTLLKALCIDSRNILFGPKWSSNMPKYAANLSNAPLQPQKQVSVPSSVVTQNEVITEKSSSKPTTWSDPFTSEGQEFTYAEALLLDLEHLMATLDQMAHNHSTLKISELLSHACNTENATVTAGPTDVDVFEAKISAKTDKIYSNPMSIQPLRQINLPDTHIFTPTDSEIPRSKTIHYDRDPAVILPQPSVSDNKNQSDTPDIPSTSSATKINDDENDYWEFQNFKSTKDSSGNSPQISSRESTFETATTASALPKSNVTYQADLLQPIKLEPTMPTLNWPNPGEVKGVFDDFSDFVSISSQTSEKQNISSIKTAESPETSNNTTVKTMKSKPDDDGFDDDFDKFQSAFPSKSDNVKSIRNTTSQISHQVTDFDNGSPKFASIKSDSISFDSILRPNEALTPNLGYISNSTELPNKLSQPSGIQIQTNLLQPTPVNLTAINSQSQQKSGQILQPLSLESYSQINWPSPGIDLQDLSRFNPVETLHSLKSDLSVNSVNKGASPVHVKNSTNKVADDDVWGEFVSSKPKQQQSQPKKPSVFVDDDEWTDFISSPSVKPPNGLNTISLNVHTNSNIQKSVQNKSIKKNNQQPLDIPTLNYITPKSHPHKSYNDKHFQDL